MMQAAVHALSNTMQIGRGSGRGGGQGLTFEFCEKHGHFLRNCLMNPDSPDNKLTPKIKDRMMLTAEKSEKPSANNVLNKKKQKGPGNFVGVILCHKVEKTTLNALKDYGTYNDSGATSYVFHSEDTFVPGPLPKSTKRTVMLAEQSSVVADHSGVVVFLFETGNIRLQSVLLIPCLGYNLVSVCRLSDNVIESFFTRYGLQL